MPSRRPTCPWATDLRPAHRGPMGIRLPGGHDYGVFVGGDDRLLECELGHDFNSSETRGRRPIRPQPLGLFRYAWERLGVDRRLVPEAYPTGNPNRPDRTVIRTYRSSGVVPGTPPGRPLRSARKQQLYPPNELVHLLGVSVSPSGKPRPLRPSPMPISRRPSIYGSPTKPTPLGPTDTSATGTYPR